MYNVYCVLYSVYCLLNAVYRKMYTAYCMLHTVYCMQYTICLILFYAYCILHNIQCILHNIYCIPYTVVCILYTKHKEAWKVIQFKLSDAGTYSWYKKIAWYTILEHISNLSTRGMVRNMLSSTGIDFWILWRFLLVSDYLRMIYCDLTKHGCFTWSPFLLERRVNEARICLETNVSRFWLFIRLG